ncbi:processed acidic surface protein [Bacillus sp. V59.32b]|uniref:processed acidic surface protein n=1 Tax=Bacillus sp. V59.32b TaxID=1758642 RepID=UPI000E3D90F1|nr:processed acidic surface protein [Bacillus sp. V59.32b]RFU67057.1 processed acidic surface protein [Bacillus sp. V59.32b]
MKKLMMIIASAVIVFMSSVPVFAAIPPAELDAYLAEVGMNEPELREYLAAMQYPAIEDYESISELRKKLGKPLTEATLAEFLDKNQMSKEELEEMLIAYGELEDGEEIVDNFYFVNDLNDYLYDQLEDEFYLAMKDVFDEFSITKEEYGKLYDHLNTVRKGSDIEGALAELDLLADEMMSVGEFETMDEISEEEVAEMLAIYDEIQRIFQVKFTYALVQNGVEKDLSLQALMEIEELSEDAVLKINVYALNTNEKLLDLIITPEMFNDDLIEDVGDGLKDATKTTPVKTEMGGKLPKTAGDYMAGMLIGLLLIGGSIVFMKKAGSVK